MPLLPATTPMPFVLVAPPRSGSTLLQRYLHAHPNAVCMHELYSPGAGTPRFMRYQLGRRSALLRKRGEPERFLSDLLLGKHPPWIRAAGFKLLYAQPREPELRSRAWKAVTGVPGMRVVHLLRNPVRCAVSLEVARQTGDWIGRSTDTAHRIDPAKLVRRLERLDAMQRDCSKRLSTLESHTVQYQDLVNDPPRCLGSVFSFLGLPRQSLPAPIRRQNARSLESTVKNMAEIESALAGTRWIEALQEAM